MAEEPAPRRRFSTDLLGLVGFTILCLAVSGIGGAITATSVGTWYQTLQKPSFNPPDWLFGPVWTVLYVMMAVAAWLVWRRAGFKNGRTALSAFLIQLGLNLGWTVLFFGLQAIGLALIEIVVLLAAIVVTATLFWRIDRWAGALLVPYGLWVAYATSLNAALWRLN